MDIVKLHLDIVKNHVNIAFNGKEPWQIVSITTSSVLFLVWLYDFLDRDESLATRTKKTVFRLAKYIPQIRRKVEQELSAINSGFEEDVAEKTSNLKYLIELPAKGFSRDEILKTIRENLALSEDSWKSGHASGAVYIHDETLQGLVADAFRISSYTNPLHPDLFPGTIREYDKCELCSLSFVL